jgi:hypothetical protein
VSSICSRDYFEARCFGVNKALQGLAQQSSGQIVERRKIREMLIWCLLDCLQRFNRQQMGWFAAVVNPSEAVSAVSSRKIYQAGSLANHEGVNPRMLHSLQLPRFGFDYTRGHFSSGLDLSSALFCANRI